MKIPRSVQAKFYDLHLKQQEEEYRQYLYSKAFSLYQTNELHAGIYLGYDSKRGNILVRFKLNKTPRRKMVFTCFSVPQEYAAPKNWRDLSYHELRNNAAYGGLVTDAISVYFSEFIEDPTWIIVGFSKVELNLIDKLRKGNILIFARHEPPREYLRALSDLSKRLTIPNAILDINCNDENWQPKLLSSKNNIPQTILEKLEEEDEVIIQGPPGTGKTYLMAQLCASFLSQKKSVIVTALTNRALMEVANKKEHLDTFLKTGKVFKTSLTTDEQHENKHLERIRDVKAINGSLILSTYYALSQYARNYPDHPIFDIVIIEEASQAFIGTLAMFKILAKKIIIVGDPLQLPPIWNEGLVRHLHEKIKNVANGLTTYAYFSEVSTFRLTETYRLPERAAKQTGIFYENTLISVSKEPPPFKIVLNESLLNPKGGVSFLYLNLYTDGRKPKEAVNFIENFLTDFERDNPKQTLAILSPFRDTNSFLQAKLYPKCKRLDNIYIETIDRIQGLTSDFTILLIPFDGVNFATNLNRFNVATSRSKTHTLIILDESFKKIDIARQGLVKQFIEEAKE